MNGKVATMCDGQQWICDWCELVLPLSTMRQVGNGSMVCLACRRAADPRNPWLQDEAKL